MNALEAAATFWKAFKIIGMVVLWLFLYHLDNNLKAKYENLARPPIVQPKAGRISPAVCELLKLTRGCEGQQD